MLLSMPGHTPEHEPLLLRLPNNVCLAPPLDRRGSGNYREGTYVILPSTTISPDRGTSRTCLHFTSSGGARVESKPQNHSTTPKGEGQLLCRSSPGRGSVRQLANMVPQPRLHIARLLEAELHQLPNTFSRRRSADCLDESAPFKPDLRIRG